MRSASRKGDLDGRAIRITAASSGIGRAAAIALAHALLTTYERIDVLANNAGGLVSKRGASADGNERTLQHNHLAPFLLTQLLLSKLAETGGRVISTASAANLLGRLDPGGLGSLGSLGGLGGLGGATSVWAGGWLAYGTSKLATILFIREPARRAGETESEFDDAGE